MSVELIAGLAHGWALGADELQWIVLRRRNFRTQTGWKTVSFVASNKLTLLRVLSKMQIKPDEANQQQINFSDERFLDWRKKVAVVEVGVA